MRAAGVAAAVLAVVLAMAPAASARKAHQFYVVGATAKVTATEDLEVPSTETDGQNDKVHAEFTLSYGFVKPRGVFGWPVMLVPFSGKPSPLSAYTASAGVKGRIGLRANGQTWIRTGGGEDTTGHYATWSCALSQPYRSSRQFFPMALGPRAYLVATQASGLFASAPATKHCTESESGALPPSIEINGGRKALAAMLLERAIGGRQLRKRRSSLPLRPAGPGTFDCRSADIVACTDKITATGTVKLSRACKIAAQNYGSRTNCDNAYPEPR